MVSLEEINEGLKNIQDHICKFLFDKTQQNHIEDVWDYEKGSGGGRSRIWEGNEHDVFEKAGVNYSGITGTDLPSAAATQLKIPNGCTYHATGVSLVLHPRNPHIPTVHMNIRYFQAGEKWWFGGGIDLTPYYPTLENIVGFHKALKEICDRHEQSYEKYKETCDSYFFIRHRNESRGVGGIFFDQLHTGPTNTKTKEELWEFIKDLGYSFPKIYEPFLSENAVLAPYTQEQRQFQLIRRSRYVEFNLIYDRGTQFGLQSSGRVESILMSLPAVAIWKYNWKPEPGSIEERVTTFYLQPQNWVDLAQK